jgi:Rrf2 family iron-sulfur cluster assembly transcriptional regulator
MENIRFISRSAEVAIDAALVIAQLQPHGYVTTSMVSDKTGLSISYLEIILKKLREGGLLNSCRGPGGGYYINGSTDDMSLWQIACVFEEPLVNKKAAKRLPMMADSFEQELYQQVVDCLSAYKVSDFVGHAAASPKPASRFSNPFKLKPLPQTKIRPAVPSFVFNLHAAF